MEEIMNLVFQGASVLLTAALAFATTALWRSTNRYVNATKEMARSTERYAEISEKLLRAEKVSFIGKMFECIHHPHVDMRTVIANELSIETANGVNALCGKLTKELLQELLEEYSSNNTESNG